MTIYGSKPYYSFTYGSPAVLDFSISPFKAIATDYGTISLSWYMPGYDATFSKLIVLRSALGFPTTADEGDLIYSTTKVALSVGGSGTPVTLTGVTSSGTKFTVSSTTGLSVGQTITVTSGTGTLSTSDITYISQILSSTTFSVNLAPSVALSGATITATNSLLNKKFTYVDSGAYIDQLTGSTTPTYTATTALAVNNDTRVTLKASNSNIAVKQSVTYKSSGKTTGPNSGSGIVGGTTVASINGTSLVLSDYANIPSDTVLTFSPVSLDTGQTYYYSIFVYSNNYWQRVGKPAAGVSIKNYNTATTMYEHLPEVYRSPAALSSFSTATQNVDLYNFLRVFAVQYDLTKTMIDNAKNRYDVKNLDGRMIPAMLASFGFNYESVLGLQQARRLLQYASFIYLNKGSVKGLKEFIAAFAGYNVTIGSIKNLLLTLDCSSFENGTGFWDITSGTATITNTNSTTEGGSPAPYLEANSPVGYLNKQAGYLKVSATSGASAVTISYGNSLDDYAISTTVTTTTTGYVTLTTDKSNPFTVGQSVNIKGLSPASVNGVYKIVSVSSSRVFTLANAAVSSGTAISGSGFASVFDPTLYGVPVTAGNYYKLGIYSQPKTGSSCSITVGINWYDQFGSYLSTVFDGPYGATTPGSWTQTINTAQLAPARAAYAVPYFTLDTFTGTPDVEYFDAAQFEQAYSTAYNPLPYTDARRLDLYLTPTRANEIINPGFETSVANWSVTNGSIALETGASNIYPTASIGAGTSVSAGSAKITATGSITTLTQLLSISNVSVATSGRLLIGTGYSTYGTNNLSLGQTITKISGTGTLAASTLISSIQSSSRFTVSPNPTGSGNMTIGVSGTKILPNLSYALSMYVSGTAGATITPTVVWKNSSGTTVQTDTGSATTLTSSFQRVSLLPSSIFGTVSTSSLFSTSLVLTTDISAVTGQSVSGAGILAGTTVSSYNSSTKTITLSQAATVTAGTTITISQMVSPATASIAVINFVFNGANGNVYYVDSVLFELAASALPYFDGGTGYRMTDDLIWESNSVTDGRGLYYKNRSAAIARLNTELTEYIPMGATFALITGRSALY
jgi:hypothetical protein